VGERSCQPDAEQKRPQRAGRQRCRQLGLGLLHLPGRQVLELDRAGLADRMIGETPVILHGAGLPRRGSVVEPVPDAGRHRAGSGDASPASSSRWSAWSFSRTSALLPPWTFCRIRRLAGEIAWGCCHALISATMSERSATHSERRSSSSGSVDGDAARRRQSCRSVVTRSTGQLRSSGARLFPPVHATPWGLSDPPS
jgi:hypothetical protein